MPLHLSSCETQWCGLIEASDDRSKVLERKRALPSLSRVNQNDTAWVGWRFHMLGEVLGLGFILTITIYKSIAITIDHYLSLSSIIYHYLLVYYYLSPSIIVYITIYHHLSYHDYPAFVQKPSISTATLIPLGWPASVSPVQPVGDPNPAGWCSATSDKQTCQVRHEWRHEGLPWYSYMMVSEAIGVPPNHHFCLLFIVRNQPVLRVPYGLRKSSRNWVLRVPNLDIPATVSRKTNTSLWGCHDLWTHLIIFPGR